MVAALVVTLAARVDYESLLPARKVVVATGEWGPVALSSEPDGGPAGRFTKAVLAMAGYEAEISFTTWDTAYQRVRDGAAFAAVPVVESESRKNEYQLSAPFFSVDYRVFFDRTRINPDRLTVSDLRNKRTAFLSGYDYWPEAAATFANQALNQNGARYTAAEAFDALARGDVDFVLEGLAQGEFIVNSPTFPVGADRFATLDPQRFADLGVAVSKQAPLHLLMPKKTRARTMAKVDEAIRRFQQTHEYRDMLDGVNGCFRQQARIVATDLPTARTTTTGFVIHPLPGNVVTVLAWGGTQQHCLPPGAPRLAEDEALVKFGPGPDEGVMVVVPQGELAMGAS